MRATTSLVMALFCTLTTLAWADDDEAKKEKKNKIPPLTFVGNYDGEIVSVDSHTDRMTIKIRDVVPQWVPNNNNNNGYIPGRIGAMNNRMNFLNGGGTYVAQEQQKDIGINLSPDVKVRLLTPPDSKKADRKKSTEDKNTGDDKATAESKKPATTAKKDKPLTAKELAEKDPDYKLGGAAGKKSDLSKGQIVRVAMGKNNDKINPQIYAMAVFVVKEGTPGTPAK